METVTTYDLPQRWADDALSRDLDIGEEVGRNGKVVTLQMTEAQRIEAYSDALHYASPFGPATEGYLMGLRHSARAAVRKLAL